MPKPKTLLRKLFNGTLRQHASRVFFAVLAKVINLAFSNPVILYTRGHMRKRVGRVVGLVAAMALVVSLAIGLAQPVTSTAATSDNLNFQARLQASSGAIVPDGNYNLEFKLYNASTGGSALWTEDYLNSASHGVSVINGYLSVNLGSITSFPTNISWDQDMYVTMNVGGTSTGSASWDGEMNPRLKLTAVPYAFQAKSAEQLQKSVNGHVATLSFADPSADNSIVLPNASGTVCLQNSTDCGFALAGSGEGGGGGTDAIQNGITLQGNANFNIRSAATDSVTGTIQAMSGQTANLLELKNDSGVVTSSFDASGSLNIASGNLAVGGTSTFKNLSDSSAAFQIQNSDGINALNVNTTTLTVTVGGILPTDFGLKSDINTGSGPYGVATGDFNGDGKMDVITANYVSSNASVFMNTGSGIPTNATSTLSTGSNPYAAATGDFNGDGKADAIIANNNSQNASVYISNGSSLPTTPTSTLTAGQSPSSVATGDFNGDGKIDAAISNTSSANILVYINTGTALPATATYTLNVSRAVEDIATGDFNGDGKLDLVAVSSNSSSVNLFINSGSALPTSVTYSLDLEGGSSSSVATGDFNGDGNTDVIAADTADNSAMVFINTGNTLATTPTTTLTTIARPYGVATGDFNGDGNSDAVITSYGASGGSTSSYVYTSNGSTLQDTNVKTLGTNTGPLAVAVADLNGDSKKDIIITNYQAGSGNTASIFFNSVSYNSLEVKGSQAIVANNSHALEVKASEGSPALLRVNTVDMEVEINSGVDGKSGLKLSQLNSSSVTDDSFTGILGLDANGNVGLVGAKAISDQLMDYWGDLAWDTTNDRLGIGNTTPDYKLDVKDSNVGGYVARIQNTATATAENDPAASANGLLIQLGPDNGDRTTGNYFIGFAGGTSGSGTVAGKIQGGSGGVAYTTSGADYAEYFKANPNDLPQPGDIVSLDPSTAQGVVRSGGSTAPFGIISANPGFLGNGPVCAVADTHCDSDYQRTNVIVGMNGQLPAKVSVANGAINIGDPIMASTTAGIGVKATGYSRIIGYAEEAASVDGMIKILVQPGIFDPVAATNLQGSGTPLTIDNDLVVTGDTTLQGTLNVGKALNAPSISVISANVSGDLTVIGTTTTGNLSVIGSATIQTLNITGVANFGGDTKLTAAVNTRQATLKSFKASKPVTPGSVVILDNRDGHEGEITTTTNVNDSRVIGVAVTEAAHEGDTIDVAISGWVQVRVDTTPDGSGHAPAGLSAGQLISTSVGEGTVQTSGTPSVGSILGKTTSKQDTNNLVWIMITLQ